MYGDYQHKIKFIYCAARFVNKKSLYFLLLAEDQLRELRAEFSTLLLVDP